MLRIGQIVATPVEGTHNEIRTVKDWELGGYVGFAGGVPLIIFGTFVENERRGAAPGDYMAVAGEIALVLHIPKAIAEQWAASGPPDLLGERRPPRVARPELTLLAGASPGRRDPSGRDEAHAQAAEPWLSAYGGAPADEERLDADTPQRFK